ncbi:uncharacterized protein CLUP02_11548 [Colletotrichum lupini]|uniref:Uncharacterized protein n=1 Tax=Colletotrichum lupini TaxID=145971 RepID=A0A9Q8WJV4_9PEZI|nr:uncharacterized protein CLUP02_11548 [Colletotrichum lupini]KAK1707424.1 hypothetical protein BDP67DRAFT_527178 [Colletotrichum lupini]UQC86049.1 hypothetical protein CLUP02_11548 [Colletotrichum lupini]
MWLVQSTYRLVTAVAFSQLHPSLPTAYIHTALLRPNSLLAITRPTCRDSVSMRDLSADDANDTILLAILN